MTTTKISWTDHTINFWWGCTQVSPACKNCYAAAMGLRFGPKLFGQPVLWGKGQPRFELLQAARKEALNLNQYAFRCRLLNGIPMVECGSTETVDCPESLRIDFTDARVPLKQRKLEDYQQLTPLEWESLPDYRPRVFVNSMSDWLDNEVPIAWLAYLLETLHLCPHLDFQLLTKRPENWEERLNVALGECLFKPASESAPLRDFIAAWLNGTPPANVWIGCTAENQEYADKRLPHLLKIPAKVRFLSCEPLLGPLDIIYALYRSKASRVCPYCLFATTRLSETHCPNDGKPLGADPAIDWLITGGESGGPARPSHPDGFRSLRDQCAAAGVPFFFKQWGEWISVDNFKHGAEGSLAKSYKGHKHPDGTLMLHLGTSRAGHLLDGTEHHAFPHRF